MAKITRNSTLRDLFNKAQKAEQTKSSKFVDERLLKFQIGSSYKLRLLYCPSEERTSPFIEQRIHRNWNPNLKKYTRVVCPSSPYLDGYEGYKACPVCQAAASLYQKKQAGDANAKILYDTAKSITENYAVVYVVSDTTEGEANATGQIKIIKYGFDIQKILDIYVMGKEVKGSPKLDDDELVGFDAFELQNGRNLVITVSEKKVGDVHFPSYTASFSSRTSDIPLTQEDVEEAFAKLRFDEDFYVKADQKEISDFYKNFIQRGSLDVEEEFDEENAELVNDDDEADEVFNTKDKPAKKSKPVIEEDDDDEDDIPMPKKSKKVLIEEDEEDDDLNMDFDGDNDDEEEIVVKKPTKKSKPVIEEDDEEEVPVKKSKTTKKQVVVEEDEDDDWDLDL